MNLPPWWIYEVDLLNIKPFNLLLENYEDFHWDGIHFVCVAKVILAFICEFLLLSGLVGVFHTVYSC